MNYYAASQLHNSTTIRNPQIYCVNRYFLMFGGFKKEFTKEYTRGGAPLHELCSLSFVSL